MIGKPKKIIRDHTYRLLEQVLYIPQEVIQIEFQINYFCQYDYYINRQLLYYYILGNELQSNLRSFSTHLQLFKHRSTKPRSLSFESLFISIGWETSISIIIQRIYGTPFQFMEPSKKSMQNSKKIFHQVIIQPPYFSTKTGAIRYSGISSIKHR